MKTPAQKAGPALASDFAVNAGAIGLTGCQPFDPKHMYCCLATFEGRGPTWQAWE